MLIISAFLQVLEDLLTAGLMEVVEQVRIVPTSFNACEIFSITICHDDRKQIQNSGLIQLFIQQLRCSQHSLYFFLIL